MNITVYVPYHDNNINIVYNFCKENTTDKCKFKEFELEQSKYWENLFFTSIKEDQLETPWIGFITPHYKKKLGYEIDFYQESLKMGNQSFKGFREENSDCLQMHPNGINLMNITLDLLNLKNNNNINTFRCSHFNYWIMSKEALIIYSKKVIEIINLWESNKELNEELNKDSFYRNLNNNILEKKTGFRHYTYHTFLLERMHKIILVSNGFKCSNIIEYNPDIIINSAILIINDKEYNVIEKINKYFKKYIQFVINNNFFEEIKTSNVKLIINNKIKVNFGDTLTSIYWRR